MKVYGTELCPDCREAFEKMKKENISYELVDIMAETKNLREFLKLRDSRVREMGGIGIPCFLMEDGSVLFEI